MADTLPAEAIDLDALAQALRSTSGWLAALDYPGVGTAMATCKRAADALGSLARRAAVPSEQEPVAWVHNLTKIVRFDKPSIGLKYGDYTPLYTHPAPAAGVNEADWQPVAFAQTLELAIDRGMTGASDLSLEHLKDMFRRLYPNMSKAKVGRWLGWAQASVVAAGCGTLDEMKAINKRCSDALSAIDTGEPK